MMNYKRYYESLKNTPEPEEIVNPMKVDYKGLIAYAASKGVEPCDLSDDEKSRFIITGELILLEMPHILG